MEGVAYKDVGGVLAPKYFRDDFVRSAITYKPRDGDITVLTYPKCGTNWTMVVIWKILTREKSSFDMVGYGDYSDHLLPWYERRNDTNVLFITYEELKSDTKTLVMRIAAFMGEQHGTSLLEDPCLLESVVHASSLDSMKTLFTEKLGERMKKMAALPLEKSLPLEALREMSKKNVETHESGGLIRKGIVGDWRNYFTSNQIVQMKAWIARKTEGSDVMALWKDCDLP